MSCPPRSFYDAKLGTCKCSAILREFFSAALNRCATPEDLAAPCQLGQYLQLLATSSEYTPTTTTTSQLPNGTCLSCASNAFLNGNTTTVIVEENRCQICTGPLPQNCLKCEEGLYLNKTDFTCRKCSVGCQSCLGP